MFEITIVALGKIKEKFWQAASLEYLKRLKPYAKIQITELKASAFSTANQEKIKQEEGERLLTYLAHLKHCEIYLLTEKGKNFDSLNFSRKILKEGKSLCFVIGGTLGFSASVLESYPQVSLSPLTFTHEMARVILLEQIYRGICIKKAKPYHY